MDQPISVAFTHDGAYLGFGTTEGRVRLESAEIVVEYQNSLMGVRRSAVEEIRIPITEIDTAEFKSGWLGSTITIRARAMKTVESIYWQEHGVVNFTLARNKEERDAAAELVSRLRLELSELMLKRENS